MIEDVPLLTIRRRFSRPPQEAVESIQGTLSGHLVDAQGGRGALDYRIRPLGGQVGNECQFVGVAVTCHCGPADNLALFGALDIAEAGDVIVAATDEFTGTSLVGDLFIGMAKNRKVRAVVTDGLVRDSEGILALDMPVYCRGVVPNSPVRNGPGTVGLPITIGGVSVDAGDIVLGDRDGVVIVPRAGLNEIRIRLEQIVRAEAVLDADVRGGLEIPDFIRKVLSSDRVHYVD